MNDMDSKIKIVLKTKFHLDVYDVIIQVKNQNLH